MHLYYGIDWASAHHDVAVVDADGRVVARRRVDNDAAGFAQLLTLLAEAGDTADEPIPVAIETHGLWVAALRATGRAIYPINPLAASRYRARYAVSGAKSDATDAVLLANILRTDRAAHRPADTDLAQAIRVLARAQQDAMWARQQIGNQIRDLLKDFYPAAIVAFADLPSGGLARADARTILAAAPTPAQAARLTPTRLRRLLIKAGRRRDLDRNFHRPRTQQPILPPGQRAGPRRRVELRHVTRPAALHRPAVDDHRRTIRPAGEEVRRMREWLARSIGPVQPERLGCDTDHERVEIQMQHVLQPGLEPYVATGCG